MTLLTAFPEQISAGLVLDSGQELSVEGGGAAIDITLAVVNC